MPLCRRRYRAHRGCRLWRAGGVGCCARRGTGVRIDGERDRQRERFDQRIAAGPWAGELAHGARALLVVAQVNRAGEALAVAPHDNLEALGGALPERIATQAARDIVPDLLGGWARLRAFHTRPG